MKRLLLILLMFLPVISNGKDWTADWYGSFRGAGSTGYYMPFWARTGEDGILPVRSSGLVTVGGDLRYRHANGLFFESGINLAGALAQRSPLDAAPVYGMVDRLYAGGGWKMLHLDIGMKPQERDLSDISVSGGNFIYSRNSRNMPGVNAWTDWIYLEKGHWVGIKGNLAHYQTIDNRYVSRAMIHNKSLSIKIALGSKVDVSAELEHWAQWGGIPYGKSEKYQVSLKDYWRIFSARKGGEGATTSDQINVLGNHLGKECLRLDWKHSYFTMTMQYDKPFEDGSGMKYRNFPDGVWSVQFLFKDREAIVTDLVMEYIQTTWQSGSAHDRPATEEEMAGQSPDDYYYGRIVLGGCDSYFANGEYMSGWTNHGRIIGLPLILPAAPDVKDGKVRGIVSTRMRGFHLGLKGFVAKKIPYSFKATYSRNHGNYNQGEASFFASRPWQLSLALEAGVDKSVLRMPLEVSLGVYGDIGKLYQNSAGITLKVGYRDFRRF